MGQAWGIRIIAENMQLLAGGRDGAASPAPRAGNYSGNYSGGYRQGNGAPAGGSQAPAQNSAPMPMEEDDDIPF